MRSCHAKSCNQASSQVSWLPLKKMNACLEQLGSDVTLGMCQDIGIPDMAGFPLASLQTDPTKNGTETAPGALHNAKTQPPEDEPNLGGEAVASEEGGPHLRQGADAMRCVPSGLLRAYSLALMARWFFHLLEGNRSKHIMYIYIYLTISDYICFMFPCWFKRESIALQLVDSLGDLETSPVAWSANLKQPASAV